MRQAAAEVARLTLIVVTLLLAVTPRVRSRPKMNCAAAFSPGSFKTCSSGSAP
jgi:hypothetical protein